MPLGYVLGILNTRGVVDSRFLYLIPFPNVEQDSRHLHRYITPSFQLQPTMPCMMSFPECTAVLASSKNIHTSYVTTTYLVQETPCKWCSMYRGVVCVPENVNLAIFRLPRPDMVLQLRAYRTMASPNEISFPAGKLPLC